MLKLIIQHLQGNAIREGRPGHLRGLQRDSRGGRRLVQGGFASDAGVDEVKDMINA